MGGLRLKMVGLENGLQKTLSTFSDGSFYSMEVPPGEYEISIDPAQLAFLHVKANPEKLYFVVHAEAEGDFIDNLNFLLSPASE